MATIVCGLSDSPAAFEALRVASVFSAELDARLVLAHAAGSEVAANSGGENRELRRDGERLLERAARAHQLQAERRVEVGDPTDALARIASEEAASLIVLGSTRRRRLRRSPGVLARDLAATAPCPVVVVPPPTRR